MKKLIKKLFPGIVNWRNRVHSYLTHYRFKNVSTEIVFETIYKENHWKDPESKSGPGSNKKETETVIKIVSDMINKLNVNSMMDIPCGDFNWMNKVDLQGINYIGADIVNELVEINSTAYSSKNIKFEKLNILESVLPKVDLIFTRDCLVHFSYSDIAKAIDSVKKSKSTYWMTTTFSGHTNHDIITGEWRPINLQAPPFNFPSPIYIYNEAFIRDARFSDKSLAVWKIADL